MMPTSPPVHTYFHQRVAIKKRDEYKSESNKEYNKNRPQSDQLYYSSRWRRVRNLFIKRNPVCCHCARENLVRVATVVDHVIPVKEGGRMFDTKNLQSLCSPCHNRKTAEESKSNDNAPLGHRGDQKSI